MAKIIQLAEADQQLLKDYFALRDVQLRKALEAENGIFIAEGQKIIERALRAGYQAKSFLLAEKWLAGLADLLEESDAPVILVSEAQAEELTGFHVHRGALAACYRPTGKQVSQLLTGKRLVVCEDIVDHSNVGAIIRCAAGLGWDGVLLAPRAADPLYRRAIKTSMGASLSLPWARMRDWANGLAELKAAGFEIVAMALSDEARSLAEFAAELEDQPQRKIALLLGTEGDGLSSNWLAQADHVVMIPMARGIDSLNVAAATAVACYELRANNYLAR